MKKDLFYLLGLLLMFLYEMVPMMPAGTRFLSILFFSFFLIQNGFHISKEYMKWILSVLILFAVSMIWANRWNLSWWVIGFNMLPIFWGTIATFCYLRKNSNNLRNVLLTYVLCTLFMTVFAMSSLDQIVQGERLGVMLSDNAMDGERVWNSNVIGVNLAFSIIIGYLVFFRNKISLLFRLLLVAVGILMFAVILLTGCRKALIMMFIAFIIIPIINQRNTKIFMYILVSASFIVFVYFIIMNVPFLYDVVGYRVDDLIRILGGEGKEAQDDSRMYLVLYGIEWFKERPLLGYGINNFRDLSNHTFMFVGRNFYAHNNYIEFLVDVGIIGFFIYYRCYYYFWKSFKKYLSDKDVVLAVVLMCSVLFTDIGQVSYYDFSIQFFICICFFVAYKLKIKYSILK